MQWEVLQLNPSFLMILHLNNTKMTLCFLFVCCFCLFVLFLFVFLLIHVVRIFIQPASIIVITIKQSTFSTKASRGETRESVRWSRKQLISLERGTRAGRPVWWPVVSSLLYRWEKTAFNNTHFGQAPTCSGATRVKS